MIFDVRNLAICCFLGTFVTFSLTAKDKAVAEQAPNVILIVTDDQGYGDIAAHGNPILKTPHLDKLHDESVRWSNFHVDPTCSPTRSALLTGRYSTRTGVWHTINGRSMMKEEELTIPEVFKANGYATAMVGKWHLGTNYPFRPSDQGFDHSIWHFDGCIGGGPDYWGNDYFDDHYMTNGKWKKYKGYCTDVWFDEAVKWIDQKKDKPFFLYLSTNAPHWPYIVDEKYSKPYAAKGMPGDLAKFYGMVTNIDENIGKFRKKLKDLGVSENTLLIFMTDNGTTAGWICLKSGYKYYNAGMRGWKGSVWEGGQRVPMFWHWPKGKLSKGREISELTAHIDVLPTLVDMLGLKKPKGPKVDGTSLFRLLDGGEMPSLKDRTLFAHVQRSNVPPKWKASVTMKQSWRLIDGEKLYHLERDPGQQKDVASKHPEVVKELRSDYEAWWESLETDRKQTVRIVLGGKENPTTLYSHDWFMPEKDVAAWHQNQIRRGELINGAWNVEVEKAGKYEISLYRWAPYLNRAMNMKGARLSVAGQKKQVDLNLDTKKAVFEVQLKAGITQLQSWLTRSNGDESGAYYVKVRYVN